MRLNIINIWLIPVVTLHNIYKLVSCIFCVQIFYSIDYLCYVSHFNL